MLVSLPALSSCLPALPFWEALRNLAFCRGWPFRNMSRDFYTRDDMHTYSMIQGCFRKSRENKIKR